MNAGLLAALVALVVHASRHNIRRNWDWALRALRRMRRCLRRWCRAHLSSGWCGGGGSEGGSGGQGGEVGESDSSSEASGDSDRDCSACGHQPTAGAGGSGVVVMAGAASAPASTAASLYPQQLQQQQPGGQQVWHGAHGDWSVHSNQVQSVYGHSGGYTPQYDTSTTPYSLPAATAAATGVSVAMVSGWGSSTAAVGSDPAAAAGAAGAAAATRPSAVTPASSTGGDANDRSSGPCLQAHQRPHQRHGHPAAAPLPTVMSVGPPEGSALQSDDSLQPPLVAPMQQK